MKKTLKSKIEEILSSNYDRGSNRKCIYCSYESTSDKNGLGMHMYKANNAPRKADKLLNLFKSEMKKIVETLPTGLFDSTPYLKEMLKSIDKIS